MRFPSTWRVLPGQKVGIYLKRKGSFQHQLMVLPGQRGRPTRCRLISRGEEEFSKIELQLNLFQNKKKQIELVSNLLSSHLCRFYAVSDEHDLLLPSLKNLIVQNPSFLNNGMHKEKMR